MLNHRALLTAKVEGTYNVDSVPTGAANAILLEKFSWSFANARMAQRMPLRTSQGKLKDLYAGTLVSFKFDVEIKGSGVAGTAPEVGPLLKACQLSETIVGGTSVTYKPASSGGTSLSMYFYRDGKAIRATGCVGKVSGSVAVGQPGKLSFEFLGHFVSETDVALATPTYNATLPVPAIGAAFSLDSTTFALTKLDFDLGITVAVPDNIVATDGYGTLQIVDRNPTATLDPEDVLAGTYNFVAKWTNGVAVTFSTGTIGSVAGNRYTITAPALVLAEQSPGDKGGIATRELKFKLAESVVDDEFSLALT